MKKKYIILLLVLTLVFVSCTMENNDDENHLDVSVDDSEIVERSEAISDTIVEEFGIDDATTIIFNEYALVSVKIAYNEDITQDHIDNITNKVLNFDDSVEEVLITDDSKIFREIDDIVFNLLQGNEYKDFLDDINEIFNSLSSSTS